MRTSKACAFIVLLFVGCVQAAAQNTAPLNEPNYNKPQIFTDLPGKLALRLANAEGLLNLAIGNAVNTTLAANLVLSGSVVSKVTAVDQSSQSVVIKSTRGAVFTFSRIKNTDGSFTYGGRMLSKAAGDALEIVKEKDGYVLQKKIYYDLINE